MSLSDDLRLALDPVAFASQILDIEPDEWQAQVLRYEGKRIILNCSRQSGKSLTSAIKALHLSIYQPGKLILLVSPSLRQSSELFRVIAGEFAKIKVPMKKLEDNRLSMTLQNRSRIISLPSKEEKIRGFSSVDLVIFDEASRIPDDLYYGVRPMIAVSDGAFIIMSTPAGKRGFFYELFNDDDEAWQRIELKAVDCPRIPAEFLEEEKEKMPPWHYEQEYECVFADSADAVFDTSFIEEAFTNEFEPFPEAVTEVYPVR